MKKAHGFPKAVVLAGGGFTFDVERRGRGRDIVTRKYSSWKINRE
jgi:hypothetical protein